VAVIRASLAHKLANQAAELARSAKAVQEDWHPLQRLARDPCQHVRFAVADILADLPDAPHALVLALARDPALAVSEPVIRLSPVLTEQDLLALVRDPPSAESRVTIARRLGLGQRVADALAASGDAPSLLALLRNTTAQLSGQTLALLQPGAARPATTQ